MDTTKPNSRRRRFLLSASTALGAVAAAGIATPFVLSMLPSARARAAAAPIDVDLTKIEPGMLVRSEWRGLPIWVLHRTPAMLASLQRTDSVVADPHSEDSTQPPTCRNEYRSIQPPWLVVIAVCTHLGCIPLAELQPGPASGMTPDWPGGFFCPCHGSKYDLAGRVYKDVPAPRNLAIPAYRFVTDERVTVGEV